MSYVKVENVSKRFNEEFVLKNVNLNIQKGEFMGLVGPNGAGKTTLINILLGLLEPNSGRVIIDGKTMKDSELELKARIGYIPQELALFDDSNCWENLMYFATLYNLYGQERKKRCEEALELAGLVKERKKKVKELSGGMKRRLNIAAAIMHKPEFIILDEPTVGVDPQSRNYIFDFLTRINKEDNVTILYTSHYMEEIERLCPRLLILDHGEEVAFGDQSSIRALVETTRNIDIRLEDHVKEELVEQLRALSGMKNLEQDGRTLCLEIQPELFSLNQAIALLEAETSILSIEYQEISLEQVFLELTGKELRV